MSNFIKLLKWEKIRRRCEKDPVFFIDNFVYTFDPRVTPQHIPFKLYDFQKDFINELHQALIHKYDLVIDKSRDMGATWCVCAFYFWAWLFVPNFSALLGSQKEEKVDKGGLPDTLFGKLDIMLRYLPKMFFPKGFNNFKHRNHMRLENPSNGAVISGESSNVNFSRSGRYASLLADEFAFWENSDAVLGATADSSPMRIFLSTPNGLGNAFADVRFGGNIKHIEMHWRLHPEKGENAVFDESQYCWRNEWYDSEVKRRLTSNIASLKLIKQELDINYIQSGDPVFPQEHLLIMSLQDQHPKKGETYALGADVSEGLEGGDRSAFTIIAKSTGEQVYAWAGKCSIDDFAWKIMEYGTKFNNALVAIERASAGLGVINIVKDKYRNLYMEKKVSARKDKVTKNVGWYTSRTSKAQIIPNLQAALQLGDIKITDKETFDELLIYSNGGNGDYSAPKGKHDDRVMALAIAWEALRSVPFPISVEEKQRRANKRSNRTRIIDDIIDNSSTGY